MSGATCTGAVDQYGQVIDVLVSARREAAAARRFFQRSLTTLKATPAEVVTDAARSIPASSTIRSPRRGTHRTTCQQPDRGRPQSAQTPNTRGLRTDHTAPTIITRTRLHAEPTVRILRTRHRCSARNAGGCRVHRIRPSDLSSAR
ncbi:DDE-type integrase/transposase/recombinase [Polymorphospora sp. NPDC050346]|uniref:DDE-type integrase/transposase/recombinase n=1 Tax=Polymorphospora sp. NPDC050346 TaxID=3155780 RepID=UPI0033D67AA5